MKDDCNQMELLLTEFADDELEAADAERVAAHVAACADCRAELNRELALRNALGGLPVQVGPSIDVPAGRSVPRSPFAGRRRRWSLAGGLAAAALAAVLFLPTGSGDAPTTVAETDIDAIRRDARTSLLLTASILAKSERHTVVDVFGRQLPAAIRGAIPDKAVTPEGGQG
ncbi:MAG: zf-HC2 domain-containing protein [bacterium]|nr:zf-HC2 domain-containing protein [bacterium]